MAQQSDKYAKYRSQVEVTDPSFNDAARVLSVVNCGLSCGLGKPKPGEMCVEAAVNFALGYKHGDSPNCVDEYLRDFKIGWNDMKGWGTNKNRADGLRRLSIIQLGTNDDFDYYTFENLFKSKVVEHFFRPVYDKFVFLGTIDDAIDAYDSHNDCEWIPEMAKSMKIKEHEVMFIITELAVQAIEETHPELESIKWMKKLTKRPVLKKFKP